MANDELMVNEELKDKLKPTGRDWAHTVVKAGISSIPIVGGAATELFSAIVTPPLSKRRDEWIESIGEGLKRLEAKFEGFKAEDLSQDEMFITTVMHATQAAIRNHQEDKKEALRNAVLNAAVRSAPEEDLQLIFLNFIDSLAPWHIRILRFFENPREWGEKHNVKYPNWSMGSPGSVLEHAFAELSGRREFYDQLVRELSSKGLLGIDSLHTTMSEQGMFASRTTAMGNQFIRYITSPLKD